MTYKKKLIEVALPLDAINRESAREKSIRHGHPSTLHLWWARRPLAAVRAVLWASLVDDPSSDPERFPTVEQQETERQRLFDILEKLVRWENSNNRDVLEAARAEISASNEGRMPNVLDPFCGGGSIPLEAQRLGLPSYAGDLNPVAVLISKAMLEVPPLFAGRQPVHPNDGNDLHLKTWERAQGLADDIRYYGGWLRDRAEERIGHLYPTVPAQAADGRKEVVVAWIWARAVNSPDPSWDGTVPLVKTWVLRAAKKGRPVVWVQPVIHRDTMSIEYQLREGGTPPEPTIRDRGGICIATGTPIPFDYIRSEGRAGRMKSVLLAIVAGGRPKKYFEPAIQADNLVFDVAPAWKPETSLPYAALGFRVQKYGLLKHEDLFNSRQLHALGTFVDLLDEVEALVADHARLAGIDNDAVPLRESGRGAVAYAEAIRTYLAFAIDKCADYWSTIVTWIPGLEAVRSTFPSHRLNMTWDHAEVNPFSGGAGSWDSMLDWLIRAVEALPARGFAEVMQMDAPARVASIPMAAVATDPPYYANVGYADLSDFFYVWLRKTLRNVWPDETSTLLVPKAEETVADPHRYGSVTASRHHFEDGMARFFSSVAVNQDPSIPVTLFYAYKQEEESASGRASTGWETFLEGLLAARLSVTATWPMRTERTNRPRGIGAAALASSIVVVGRPRSADAPFATRGEFLTALRSELPQAVRILQNGSIAPVDMAQSAIGPGIAIFSRYGKVLEADGSRMTVRQALVLVNEVLQEALSAEETEFDGDTRWALTWFEQNGTNPGPYGDAETLSKAKNTSVAGVIRAGIAVQRDGQVRLVSRDDLSVDWDPTADPRLTVWEIAQHLIERLDKSEASAAELLRQVGMGIGERARQLAYLLFQIADRRAWADEAIAYNSLVQAWPELARLAGRPHGAVQQVLGE